VSAIDFDAIVEVLHVSGVEGPSIYVNDYRVAGPKPWGGGSNIAKWKATPRDFLTALGIPIDSLQLALEPAARIAALEAENVALRAVADAARGVIVLVSPRNTEIKVAVLRAALATLDAKPDNSDLDDEQELIDQRMDAKP
jgi:hypothetical protein